jgi:UDP:flavonoid glycosyltransferase YjiC (YdhE family)
LIATAGSHGDVLPFIALARKFASHGYETILYTTPFFRRYVEDAGIQFVPVGTIEQYESLFEELADANPIRAFRSVAAEYAALCPDYHQSMKADTRRPVNALCPASPRLVTRQRNPCGLRAL